jgi:hypothetical protein
MVPAQVIGFLTKVIALVIAVSILHAFLPAHISRPIRTVILWLAGATLKVVRVLIALAWRLLVARP